MFSSEKIISKDLKLATQIQIPLLFQFLASDLKLSIFLQTNGNLHIFLFLFLGVYSNIVKRKEKIIPYLRILFKITFL